MMLKKVLSKIDKELEERRAIKDELYDGMRKAIRLSKKAIFLIHKRKVEEAKKLLDEACQLFTKLDKIPMMHKQLVYAGIVDAAFQEYAEANIFLKLLKDAEFIAPEDIGVPSTSYLLGLADVIGELRRKVLDSLREGNIKNAEKSLKSMELIYGELMVMDEALRSVSEFRHKSDVARKIVEATRGDVTIEVRRSSLENSIQKLEETLKTKKS